MLTAWRLTALVPVIVVLISAPAAAQSFYGSLISVTQDAQGGVIPGPSGKNSCWNRWRWSSQARTHKSAARGRTRSANARMPSTSSSSSWPK